MTLKIVKQTQNKYSTLMILRNTYSTKESILKNLQITQYNTIQYNTIQYNTIQYNTIQYDNILLFFEGKGYDTCC